MKDKNINYFSYIDKEKEYLENNKNCMHVKNAYNSGWIQGREDLVQKLIDLDILQIKPEFLDYVKISCRNPCLDCQYKSTHLKIGCRLAPSKCRLKQQQLFMSNVYDWFVNKYISEPI